MPKCEILGEDEGYLSEQWGPYIDASYALAKHPDLKALNISDMHEGNVGKLNGEFVILDYGG